MKGINTFERCKFKYYSARRKLLKRKAKKGVIRRSKFISFSKKFTKYMRKYIIYLGGRIAQLKKAPKPNKKLIKKLSFRLLKVDIYLLRRDVKKNPSLKPTLKAKVRQLRMLRRKYYVRTSGKYYNLLLKNLRNHAKFGLKFTKCHYRYLRMLKKIIKRKKRTFRKLINKLRKDKKNKKLKRIARRARRSVRSYKLKAFFARAHAGSKHAKEQMEAYKLKLKKKIPKTNKQILHFLRLKLKGVKVPKIRNMIRK
jgi:hypothetical protein